MIEYHVCIKETMHCFEIQARLNVEPHTPTYWVLPTWIPGSYLKRDFSKHMVGFELLSAGTWQAMDCDRLCILSDEPVLRFRYQIYAYAWQVRGAYLDHRRGFAQSVRLFLCRQDAQGDDIATPYQIIWQDLPEGWRLWSSIDPDAQGHYVCTSYADLAECPWLLGRYQSLELAVPGHRWIMHEDLLCDTQRLCADVAAICHAQGNFFSGCPQRYTFFFLDHEGGYGGLEHAESTVLMHQRSALPQDGTPFPCPADDPYADLLTLISHEYFHRWWVKQCRPDVFQHYRWDKTVCTSLLWIFEGWTSFFETRFAIQADVLDEGAFLQAMGIHMSRTHLGLGYTQQSVAESSWYAWTRFYQQDENARNAIVSYYSKGALCAWWLDIVLMHHTQGRVGLDKMLTMFWQKSQQQPRQGLSEAMVRKALLQVLDEKTCRVFWDGILQGRTEMVFEHLSTIGVALSKHPLNDESMLSHKRFPLSPAQAPQEACQRLLQGARYTLLEQGIRIEALRHDCALAQAGLWAGDLLIAIDGYRCTAATLAQTDRAWQKEASLRVHFFRDHHLLQADVKTQSTPCALWLFSVVDPALWQAYFAPRQAS